MAILDDIITKLPGDDKKTVLEFEIRTSLQHLPECIAGKNTLESLLAIRCVENRLEQVSYFNAGTKILILTPPFGFDMSTYISLDKKNINQRFLMDAGAFIGLFQCIENQKDRNIEDEFAGLRNAIGDRLKLNLSKDNWMMAINDLKATCEKIDSYHIMAGISDFNCQETLLQWTIRHEIGHAVDAMIKWSADKERIFDGGWKLYNDENDAFIEYENDGGNQCKNEFIVNCKGYPFIYDDGGEAKGNSRIFMFDEYGHWCSYLKTARNYAVSNYQFASYKEWFAEVFAAYYGPCNKSDIEGRLGRDICDFFERTIGKRKD